MTTDTPDDVTPEPEVEGFATRDKRGHVAGRFAETTTPPIVTVVNPFAVGIDVAGIASSAADTPTGR